MDAGGMPSPQLGVYLRLWERREDKINLVGATQANTVCVRYEKVLPALTLSTDPMHIRLATETPTGLRHGSSGCAGSRGARALAANRLDRAQSDTEKLI